MKLKVIGRVWASRVEIGVGMGLAPALLSVRSILQGSQPSFTSTALCSYLVTALECRDVSQERLTNPLGKKLFTSSTTKTLRGRRERDSGPQSEGASRTDQPNSRGGRKVGELCRQSGTTKTGHRWVKDPFSLQELRCVCCGVESR